MTHPGQPRDVDLDAWLDGVGFKPANTEKKQLGFEATRRAVASLGVDLHIILPAGRDKSLVFTQLEDVLMRANRALAVGGGPQEKATPDFLRVLTSTYIDTLPRDPRIAEYEAGQLAGAKAGV